MELEKITDVVRADGGLLGGFDNFEANYVDLSKF